MLIEELNGGKGSQGAETEKLRRGGVIIEELTNEETLDDSESEQHSTYPPKGQPAFLNIHTLILCLMRALTLGSSWLTALLASASWRLSSAIRQQAPQISS